MPRKPYDHRRHGGNQGDVWKHAALVAVLAGMVRDDATGGRAFRFGETHAGPGGVPLNPGGEWERGIGRLLKLPPVLGPEAFYPEAVLAEVRRTGVHPGSWRIAASWLAKHAKHRSWELALYELNGEVHAAAEATRAGTEHPERISLTLGDGFSALAEDDGQMATADLVLIDPPYMQDGDHAHDWERVHDVVRICRQRGQAFLLWYPVFWFNNPQRLVDSAGTSGLELIWAELGSSRPGYASKGAGLLAGGDAVPHLCAAAIGLEKLATALGGRLTFREPTASVD